MPQVTQLEEGLVGSTCVCSQTSACSTGCPPGMNRIPTSHVLTLMTNFSPKSVSLPLCLCHHPSETFLLIFLEAGDCFVFLAPGFIMVGIQSRFIELFLLSSSCMRPFSLSFWSSMTCSSMLKTTPFLIRSGNQVPLSQNRYHVLLPKPVLIK